MRGWPPPRSFAGVLKPSNVILLSIDIDLPFSFVSVCRFFTLGFELRRRSHSKFVIPVGASAWGEHGRCVCFDRVRADHARLEQHARELQAWARERAGEREWACMLPRVVQSRNLEQRRGEAASRSQTSAKQPPLSALLLKFCGSGSGGPGSRSPLLTCGPSSSTTLRTAMTSCNVATPRGHGLEDCHVVTA